MVRYNMVSATLAQGGVVVSPLLLGELWSNSSPSGVCVCF